MRISDWSSDVCSSDLASIGLVESWRWLADLEGASGWKILDDVTVACAQAVPALAGIVSAAPNAAFRIDGMKIAREPPRYSGRTAMRANQSGHEPRQPPDADTALSLSMEGYNAAGSPRRPDERRVGTKGGRQVG